MMSKSVDRRRLARIVAGAVIVCAAVLALIGLALTHDFQPYAPSGKGDAPLALGIVVAVIYLSVWAAARIVRDHLIDE